MTSEHSFGYPSEWDDFARRNQAFLAGFPKLKEALDTAFVRGVSAATPADRAILFLGRLSVEDFMELICLAANGYGVGAMKLLRGLYERAVTAAYLEQHPEEVQHFLDFRFVSRYKALNAYVEGGTRDENWVKKARDARAQYDKVKMLFQVDDCKDCGTKRINHTWSKKDFVAMAKSTGELGNLLAQAYYEPLNHAHSTAEAIFQRLELSDAGGIGFRLGPQRDDADRAVRIAHAVIVALLEVQARHFGLEELAAKVSQCSADHIEIWSTREMAINPNE